MHGSRAHPKNLASQAVHPTTHGLGIPLSKVGFPIRISADQSFVAAPHGFSQRSTSFIASQRQGIHRMPLRHLIALIINAHRTRRACRSKIGRDIDEKDQLAFFKIDPTACGQARRLSGCRATVTPFGDDGARIDLLFTMSDNTHLTEHEPEGARRTDANSFAAFAWRTHARTSTAGPQGRHSEDPTGGARRDRTDDLLLAKQALSQLSYGPKGISCLPARRSHRKPAAAGLRVPASDDRIPEMVGLDRLERSTSPLSGVRSNHLSYRPVKSTRRESRAPLREAP